LYSIWTRISRRPINYLVLFLQYTLLEPFDSDRTERFLICERYRDLLYQYLYQNNSTPPGTQHVHTVVCTHCTLANPARSWSAENGKEKQKRKSGGALPPGCSLGENKVK
jgi:hypothetical protein